ncbi:CobW family GTP-binding protein [Pseudochelatococcus contaminans]|uniref:G3E family GTPase n=1 Tax=Pseudochelatococcus contaminans TaxID=1538103 RepID=A0A7W5Z3C9_9HYPH|nr:GTP-binding protein [Pseudochelatococcus contaminans]MBB3809278.1 G3E family GTPase [Pseudochelatococcus contaminans]
MAKTHVTVLNGFLGSGKTTLLNALLHQARKRSDIRLAVIANDMGEIDIDADVIANTDLVGGERNNFISIDSGSLSSRHILPRFREALARLIAEDGPTHILVETSGSTHPWPLVEALRDTPEVELHGCLALIDSVMLLQDFDKGRGVVEGLQRNLAQDQQGVENLLAGQIMFANRLVLTKTDRLPDGALQEIAQAIHPLNPYADITGMSWGGLRLDDVFAMPPYDFHRVARLGQEFAQQADDGDDPADPAAYRIVSRTLNDPRPFHPQRLWTIYNRFLGTGIHRSKGFFWLPSRDDQCLLWNQAAGSINLEVVSYWRIAALSDLSLKLTPEERTGLAERLAGLSPVFGDRRCQLVIIGQEQEIDPFVDALKTCFCTEDEIVAWQHGEHFEDPWPRVDA